MERLPDELMFTILSHVPPEDIVLNCRLVCKRWYGLCRCTTLWKYATVFVECSKSCSKSQERVLALAPVLGHVHLNGTPDPRTIGVMLRGCHTIYSLSLHIDHDWPAMLMLLEHCKDNVHSLQILFDDELPVSLLLVVATMKNLKKLVLADLELSLVKASDWTPFENLCEAVATLTHLNISGLVHVVFSHASVPLDNSIKKFSNTLTNLYLPSAPATASLIDAVSQCTKLEKLEISYPADMTLDHIEAALGRLESLTCLNIWVCDDADSHFPEFICQTKLFRTLQELEVGFSFPDKDNTIADAIAKRSQGLKVLSLPGSGRGKNLSPQGLRKIICHSKSLRRLNLNLQKAFSADLLEMMIHHLPSLEYLDVSDSHLLSNAVVETLQTALPKLFMRWTGEDFEEYMGYAKRHVSVSCD